MRATHPPPHTSTNQPTHLIPAQNILKRDLNVTAGRRSSMVDTLSSGLNLFIRYSASREALKQVHKFLPMKIFNSPPQSWTWHRHRWRWLGHLLQLMRLKMELATTLFHPRTPTYTQYMSHKLTWAQGAWPIVSYSNKENAVWLVFYVASIRGGLRPLFR